MAEFVSLAPEKLSALREMNPCLMSYNMEFKDFQGDSPDNIFYTYAVTFLTGICRCKRSGGTDRKRRKYHRYV